MQSKTIGLFILDIRLSYSKPYDIENVAWLIDNASCQLITLPDIDYVAAEEQELIVDHRRTMEGRRYSDGHCFIGPKHKS